MQKTNIKSAKQRILRAACALLAGTIAVLSSAPVLASYQKGAQLYLKKEYKNAYVELLPAAEAGHALAQFMVAVMHDVGHYVKKDGKAAAEWYRKASEQGHPDAQLRLASMLYEGIDVPLDREAAYQWASLAADRLHGSKQEKAATFVRSVAALLSRTQLERAKTAIAAWRPRIAMADRSTAPQRLLRTGTGFFLNNSGTLLTNQHVAYACQRLIASYGDRTANGALLDVDFGADLATVQTDIKPSSFARFASEQRPKPGIPVTVIGYAIKQTKSRDTLTSSGTVSNPGVALGNAAWFQTSVPIYRGQSGSPAFDSTGLVVGVARGVFQGQPDGEQQEAADGQAMVVGIDSISRFLGRAKTPFEKAPQDHDAPSTVPAFPSDFIVLLECWGSY
ncbi:MAG: tetratricopeptide repeat-containing serine protease family protein [Gallionella sp.]|nr:tetratricopeptide repeat-containing serine protease family protein [Gallionella sp.]